MTVKHPIEFNFSPQMVEQSGTYWVTLTLKNIGSKILSALDVRLNSLDSYAITIHGRGRYIPTLSPNAEQVMFFQIEANNTARLYVTISGKENDTHFRWESLGMIFKVGVEVAQLRSVFVLTEPYPQFGKALTCEATVVSNKESAGLSLEFWLEHPSGRVEDLGKMKIKKMSAGETARQVVQMKPEEEGVYRVHFYLYHKNRRIGYETDTVWVT
jgi:hypothetical protein